MHEFSPFWSSLRQKTAKLTPKIAFADATDPRILKASQDLLKNKIADPILVGSEKEISTAIQKAGVPELFDKKRIFDLTQTPHHDRYVELLLEKQRKQNRTRDEVNAQLADPLYQSIAALLDNQVDGLIAGATRPTGDVVRAALQCIGAGKGSHLVSGHFLIESESTRTGDQTPYLFADCAVMPEPSTRALAAIAIGAADSYKFFTGKTARVALLSFSTRDSAQHELVERIKEALAIIRKQEPNLLVDGELQVDAAMDPEIAVIKKAGDSNVAGKANVFVFPTLEAGNIGYKLVQRFSKTRIAGPLLWGLGKPVSDLSRGCTVQEVADTALCLSHMIGAQN